jgi:hypothetical protein
LTCYVACHSSSKRGPEVIFPPYYHSFLLSRLGICLSLGDIVGVLNFEVFRQVQSWLSVFNLQMGLFTSLNLLIG